MSEQKDIQSGGFVKEVARYFMNFLETDFKKRRIPKRNTVKSRKDGFQVGLNLDKYPSLKADINKLINKGFEGSKFVIPKGKYVNKIPENLLNMIKRKIQSAKRDDLDVAIKEMSNTIIDFALVYKKDYESFLDKSTEEAVKVLSKKFIQPILDQLDKPLENLGLADENAKYQLELDILDVILSSYEKEWLEIFEKFFGTPQKVDLNKEMAKILKLKRLILELESFFDDYSVKDAFLEVYQLERNNNLLDKTELYLYFHELRLGNDEKFPLFYIPITLNKEERKFELIFDRKVYVNTKAIDYVVQEYNLNSKKLNTLTGEFERIIYLNDEKTFFENISTLIRVLENFFEFNKEIDLKRSEYQSSEHLITGLSNKQHFYLFDKSDEALINDYEEILNDDSDLLQNFTALLNGFVFENPEEVISAVDEEWIAESYPEKLVFQSPIPLNEEQKRILKALDKPDCKFTVIEGPPGTGKSHTITAIVCKALLDGKSILVLSDKKEALDVVEDKITSTLNNIRHEEDFQNPILRLGRSGNKFGKIVKGQTIQKIKDHYIAYRSKEAEFNQKVENLTASAKSGIQESIKHYSQIDLNDIKYYHQNKERFSSFNWIEGESPEVLEPKLLRVKSIISSLKKKKNGSMKASLVSEEFLSGLIEVKDSLTSISSKKNPLKGCDFDSPNTIVVANLAKEKEKNNWEVLCEISSEFERISASQKKHVGFGKELLTLDLTFTEVPDAFEAYEKQSSTFNSVLKYKEGLKVSTELLIQLKLPNEVTFREGFAEFQDFSNKLKLLHRPIIGFFLKKAKVHDLAKKLRKVFYNLKGEDITKHYSGILEVCDLFTFVNEKSDSEEVARLVWQLLTSGEEEFKVWSAQLHFFSIYKSNKKIFRKMASQKVSDIKTIIDLYELFDLIEGVQNRQDILEKLEWDVLLSEEYLLNNSLDEIVSKLTLCEGILKEFIEQKEELKFLMDFQKDYLQLSEKISLNLDSENLNQLSCLLVEVPENEISDYCKFKKIEFKLTEQFTNAPEDSFADTINDIETLVAGKMTHFLDERIINYSQKFAGDLQTLKAVIKNKEQFPKKLFENLKKAFPCIIAGIRDYAEYIPLEKDLFDLIIIDEASQVSIAQALPALIRGKQIVVLGDDMQFSNVKSNNASKMINQELRQKVEDSFKKEFSQQISDSGQLIKVRDNFDIKNSILQFVKFIRNYECQLRKHFRCYPEIISYSDKNFYNYSLQAMKVRGKSIDEVIKFSLIEHDGKLEVKKNINTLEADAIIKALLEFKEKGVKQSIGIISPHREQVTYLYDKISNLKERDWLFEECKLKIMTFDSCQGEERDYIFYSMVATREDDKLRYIFLKDLSKRDLEMEGTVKAQRLNVGFSRAKETVHFIISKPVEEFDGEIKNALVHFQNEKENAKKQIIGGTDDNSPMEDEVQKIFYQTRFYKENKANIEFIPQFPIGDYLKSLNKDYRHPAYKVDFLLMYENKKYIIEYDGFNEHFKNKSQVNKSNFQFYMNDDDIYRQKILEGYGYRFIRINKFNLGKDPVATLDQRINDLVKKKSEIII
jgi:hypothetical protein